MNHSQLQQVSDTAFLTAQCRALESSRADALFRDPLAAELAGTKGQAIAAAFPTLQMTSWTIAVRTVIIDGFVMDSLARGVDCVINLGAGLDTRPYRLALPAALKWVELDYPEVITLKEHRLASEQPRCKLERWEVDLADAAARKRVFAELASNAQRPLILTEGVLPYLDMQQVAALARDLDCFTNLDGWIVDYISSEAHAYRKRAGLDRHMAATPFKFQPEDWFAFFGECGFAPLQMRYLPEVGMELGRPAPLPLVARLFTSWLRFMAPKERRQRMSRFSGYALLERKALPG